MNKEELRKELDEIRKSHPPKERPPKQVINGLFATITYYSYGQTDKVEL